ncbi:DUF2147 domain-containing protein [Roseibium porphyridii]|uniref:DUF2147 domain-containing protein n=1 Tax=Roseibium porphyridii TaxID=2866279 RepID=A0ABY8EYZ0_9HYPH|nr:MULTISPECIES: DUF2147 domain-containing protein [Stappiaceae]QFT33068.1 hypothetical protein FIV00_21430 [Labrenzia sp. THAF82]WFE88361.1 DUF2147 domain-containing protein [Roseibium sp. KMA01]
MTSFLFFNLLRFPCRAAFGIAIPVLLLLAAPPATAAPDISGNWKTPAGAIINISTCGSAPCGKIVRFTPPKGYTMKNTPDLKNRDASKRGRKILGLKVLWRMKSQSNAWKGRVYDPRRGFSANATIRKKGGSALEVQGCVRVVFNVCEKEVWRKVN